MRGSDILLTQRGRSVALVIGIILALLGIYFEESGVPMPVPSEISIAYIGHRIAENPVGLAAAWLGITLWIVMGASNLFWLSRWLGPRMLGGRLAVALHLTPQRIARATSWFKRWGWIAIGVARFVPGLRWAMAVVCGTFGVSYRAFALNTGIAAGIWSGLLLTLGVTLGDPIGRLFVAYPWVKLLLPLPALIVVSISLTRIALHPRAAAFPTAAPAPSMPIGGGVTLRRRHISSAGGA